MRRVLPMTRSERKAARLRCPHCAYALVGLSKPRCPECCEPFDPEVLARAASGRWKTRVRSLAVMLVCLYPPYGWLLVTDYPWGPYRWQWLKSWPVLPGLLPGGVLFRGSSTAIKYTAMGVFTAVLLVGLTWLGSRSRRLLLIVALIVLALSALNSWGAYHVFRA